MNILTTLLSSIFVISFSAASMAQETSAPAPTPATEPAADVRPTTWNELLQKKYSLTEAEVKSLQMSKISESQQAKAVTLARISGKTVDDVLNMRLVDKMGWGKIAKTLGVAPGELGKAVNEMNNEWNVEKNRVKKEKRNADLKAREEAKAAKLAEKRKDQDSKLRPNDKSKPESDERGQNR